MTQPWRRFPDVQAALVALLEQLAGGAQHTGIETPENLQDVMPFIRVRRVAGASDQLHDYADVDVDVFAAEYRQAEPLAERVRQFLTGPKHRVGDVVLDRIVCQSAPVELPWAPGVRRIGATYLVVSRRYTAVS